MDPFISLSPPSIAASVVHALLLPGCLLFSATLALESLNTSATYVYNAIPAPSLPPFALIVGDMLSVLVLLRPARSYKP
ncbi:unnamed protein product, partial [Tilletia controversa]